MFEITQSTPPSENEPICLISFEIARIRVGGGPDGRTGFWKAYYHEREVNRKTNFVNYHVELCKHQLVHLKHQPAEPVYFRGNKLTWDPAQFNTQSY